MPIFNVGQKVFIPASKLDDTDAPLALLEIVPNRKRTATHELLRSACLMNVERIFNKIGVYYDAG